MLYWTGLYSKKDPEMLLEGVNVMLQVATGLLGGTFRESGDHAN